METAVSVLSFHFLDLFHPDLHCLPSHLYLMHLNRVEWDERQMGLQSTHSVLRKDHHFQYKSPEPGEGRARCLQPDGLISQAFSLHRSLFISFRIMSHTVQEILVSFWPTSIGQLINAHEFDSK